MLICHQAFLKLFQLSLYLIFVHFLKNHSPLPQLIYVVCHYWRAKRASAKGIQRISTTSANPHLCLELDPPTPLSSFLDAPTIVCKIPLLARRTRPKGQARRAMIGYLVYKPHNCWKRFFNLLRML